jgi:hypothetical protein
VFPRNASRVLLAISYAIGQRSIRSRLTGTGLLRGARGLSAQYGSRFGKSLRNKCGPWPSVPTNNPSNKRQLYYGTALGKRRILPRDHRGRCSGRARRWRSLLRVGPFVSGRERSLQMPVVGSKVKPIHSSDWRGSETRTFRSYLCVGAMFFFFRLRGTRSAINS